MKKLIFLLFAFVAFASCSKEEILVSPETEEVKSDSTQTPQAEDWKDGGSSSSFGEA